MSTAAYVGGLPRRASDCVRSRRRTLSWILLSTVGGHSEYLRLSPRRAEPTPIELDLTVEFLGLADEMLLFQLPALVLVVAVLMLSGRLSNRSVVVERSQATNDEEHRSLPVDDNCCPCYRYMLLVNCEPHPKVGVSWDLKRQQKISL